MLGNDNTSPLDPSSQYLVNVTKSDLILQKMSRMYISFLLFQYNSVMLNLSLRSLCQCFLSEIIWIQDNYYKKKIKKPEAEIIYKSLLPPLLITDLHTLYNLQSWGWKGLTELFLTLRAVKYQRINSWLSSSTLPLLNFLTALKSHSGCIYRFILFSCQSH